MSWKHLALAVAGAILALSATRTNAQGWQPANEIPSAITSPAPASGGFLPPSDIRSNAPPTNELPRRWPSELISTPTGEPIPQAEVKRPPIEISFYSRSDQGIPIEWAVNDATGKSVGVINAGVNVLIDNVPEYRDERLGTIDISADRVVVWTANVEGLMKRPEKVEIGDVELELYMEGNIVFRQDSRVIYANRMYYDVNRQVGKIIDADVHFPSKEFGGLLRLKADVLRQDGPRKLFTEDAWVTGSRLGVPGYRLQANDIEFEDITTPMFDEATGEPVIDPDTFEQEVEHDWSMSATNNWLFIRRVPVFYWPWIASDIDDPTFFLRDISFGNDSVNGQQIKTDWNAYQIFGIEERPEDTKWDLSLDYLQKRGFGHGSNFTYSGDDIFTWNGVSAGLIDYWGIKDRGKDNLGYGRRSLEPEASYRGRFLWRHREQLQNGWLVTGEAGWVSDRNFLEEYFEREWDEIKDQDTRLELKGFLDTQSWDVEIQPRVNEFVTQTEWLPRADHFWIGQDLFAERVTWHEHTYLGYGQLRVTDRPENPADAALFHYLPWELDPNGDPMRLTGEVFTTRHEFEAPMYLGPVKFTPFVGGQFDHWGEAPDGEAMQRLVGQAGFHATLPMWKIYPDIKSDLFNVDGVAHKINFDLDYLFADSNQDLDDVPLYDPLDDNSIEAFRRRFIETTYGGALPRRFDERYYALRSGMQGWVTAPSPQIADDLSVFRLGMRHRWQTKRGMPGDRHILDWITFDTGVSLFPDSARDNFGETLGLADYDFRWHVGDRLTLISTGEFDFFDGGQRLVSAGAYLNKIGRGSIYVGAHSLEGQFSSSILSMSMNYRLSEKWLTSFGTAFDLSDDRNVGQNFAISRIGESFTVRIGVSVDASRDNYGIRFGIQPRFLKRGLGDVLGASQMFN